MSGVSATEPGMSVHKFVGLAKAVPVNVISTDCPGVHAEGVAPVSAGAWARPAAGKAATSTKAATKIRRISGLVLCDCRRANGAICRQEGRHNPYKPANRAGPSLLILSEFALSKG